MTQSLRRDRICHLLLFKPSALHGWSTMTSTSWGQAADEATRSALLDDGVDDALGDVDDGFADPREAAVQFAARDPL
jgi:hypothetical protein